MGPAFGKALVILFRSKIVGMSTDLYNHRRILLHEFDDPFEFRNSLRF